MRISFDLDDTLICYDPNVPCEPRLAWYQRVFAGDEPLRLGSRSLMSRLREQGWEIWVYTTSYRRPAHIRRWLRCHGIRVMNVINQDVYEAHLKKTPQHRPPTKNPKAFGIDLHVDDLEGVRLEGEAYGFRVLVVRRGPGGQGLGELLESSGKGGWGAKRWPTVASRRQRSAAGAPTGTTLHVPNPTTATQVSLYRRPARQLRNVRHQAHTPPSSLTASHDMITARSTYGSGGGRNFMSAMLSNPYRPGAGHSPPHLAGRSKEINDFRRFLSHCDVLKNVVLTGLRGVGKTVLMDDKYRPEAIKAGWAWVGSDFSESAFLSEENLCTRLLTDLSVFSSSLRVTVPRETLGFTAHPTYDRPLDFGTLSGIFENTPGLAADKLKAVLGVTWEAVKSHGIPGIVFAYDESQVVSDQEAKGQYPLAVLLETFQSLQRRGANYLLLLTGLPTLFPKLVASRTYAERMFSVQEIGRISASDSRDAIEVPLKGHKWKFTEPAVQTIIDTADGYPYFIQFICRQAFDFVATNPTGNTIPIDPIVRQLDSNFFAGRWETLTDRQRELLYAISACGNADEEFSISDIVLASKTLAAQKSFSAGDISQMLPRMIERGLVFKNRYGKYAFAVPLFSRFIRRTVERRSQLRQKTLFD